MNEQQFHRMNDDVEAGGFCLAALESILKAHGKASINDLYHHVYRQTPCGPWLSVKLHDGTLRHCDALDGIENGNIRAILVGSIIEGSDAEVTADWLDLLDYEEPEAAVVAFDTTVHWVNDSVDELAEKGESND